MRKLGTALGALGLGTALAFGTPVVADSEPQAQAAAASKVRMMWGGCVDYAASNKTNRHQVCADRTEYAGYIYTYQHLHVLRNGTNVCYRPNQWIAMNGAETQLYGTGSRC